MDGFDPGLERRLRETKWSQLSPSDRGPSAEQIQNIARHGWIANPIYSFRDYEEMMRRRDPRVYPPIKEIPSE